MVLDHLGEPDEWLKRCAGAERLGRENSLPIFANLFAPLYSGVALIRKGRLTEGITSLKAGLGVWEAGGERLGTPYFKSVLAEGIAQLGDLDAALVLIDESMRKSSGQAVGRALVLP
jgi:hypothetical protein